MGYFLAKHKDISGKVIWEDEGSNFLFNEGQKRILDIVFRGATAITSFKLRLFNDTPVKADQFADLVGEPSGNGYAAIDITKDATGWPTLALDSGDYMITSKVCTFTAAGGSIGPVTYMVLTAIISSVEYVFAAKALSQPRTLSDGESLEITYQGKEQ